MKYSLSFLIAILAFSSALSQGSTEYTGGLKVPLNEDGSKYFRLITWHQAWITGKENSEANFQVSASLRRSRFLMYAQISKRFLILTHFGLNSLNASNLHPVGKSASAALFMHDAWVEYSLIPQKLNVGGGLHYWNGISRLTNQSTLNMLTLDAPRFNWPTIGTSDQFARHIGVYAKGKLGKLDYRLAWNQALTTSLDVLNGIPLQENTATYQSAEIFGDTKARNIFQGYIMYQFLDQESNFLPYVVGSYLGEKRVFNIGAGFFNHVDGTIGLTDLGDTTTYNVNLFSVDAFYDAPVGDKGAAITAYGAFYSYDFGPNYRLTNSSNVIASGNIFYTQAGYLLPEFWEKGRLQPYFSASYRDLEAFEDPAITLSTGANWYISGHNAKISAEFIHNSQGSSNSQQLRLQGMIYL